MLVPAVNDWKKEKQFRGLQDKVEGEKMVSRKLLLGEGEVEEEKPRGKLKLKLVVEVEEEKIAIKKLMELKGKGTK